MIRVALIATSFVALTAALVLLQPGGPRGERPAGVNVTRGSVDLTGLVARSDAAPVDQPGAGAAAAVATALTAVQTQAALRTDDSSLSSVTDGVLTELGLPGAATAPAQAEQMQDMTRSALANISALRQTQTDGPAPQKLQALISQALREGQSDAYIDALLNEAAGKGDITVPKALVTSDGRVDTSVLLADIVARANSAATGETAPRPVDVIAGGQGVEVRLVQKADGQAVQYRFYTVSKGDSLGAIAVKFYGDVTHFSAIFEANRAILSSPDRIRAGQRLVIPTI